MVALPQTPSASSWPGAKAKCLPSRSTSRFPQKKKLDPSVEYEVVYAFHAMFKFARKHEEAFGDPKTALPLLVRYDERVEMLVEAMELKSKVGEQTQALTPTQQLEKWSALYVKWANALKFDSSMREFPQMGNWFQESQRATLLDTVSLEFIGEHLSMAAMLAGEGEDKQ